MVEQHTTLIVESDSLVREGLKLLLERSAFDPSTFDPTTDAELPAIDPAIVILFARGRDGMVELLARLRDRYGQARIVVLADEGDFKVLASAMEAGANAILLTSISADGLVKSLQAVVADNLFVMDARMWPGSMPLSPNAAPAQEDPASTHNPNGLSLREVEILQRIVEGDSNKHIARHLDIAEVTVKAHVKTVLRKIRVSNRTQAAIWAVSQGVGQVVNEPMRETTVEAEDDEDAELPPRGAESAPLHL